VRIAYISSEIVPFASSGGLGDVAAALPAAIQRRGHEVWRAMPLYRRVAEGPHKLTDTGLRFHIPVGQYLFGAEIWKSEDPPPTTYFVRRDEFFDRRELYSLPERDYEDNLERFVFFQKAVVSLMTALGKPIDIVHCNDWQTGLLPLYLKHGLHGNGRTFNEKVVLTIHNLAFQGIFPSFAYYVTNLPMSVYGIDGVEFYGNFSCIKGGITTAHMVTTVSPTYAKEIRTEAAGCGLHGVLNGLGDRLRGIMNGVDYDTWDPARDAAIAQTYSADAPDGKRACKDALRRTLGLAVESDVPLIGMVSRLADQKGLDLLAVTMSDIMKLDVQFALLGAGQDKYQELVMEWTRKWPGRFGARIGFDPELSHQIEAGADLFLMPSQFEPCGLNQLYSLRYGAVPVVHATGGLDDSIADVDDRPGEGTGIKFRDYTPDGLMKAIWRALKLYKDASAYRETQRRGMLQNHSWDQAADEYVRIYAEILSRPFWA
jgi:starch synthase